MPLVDVSRIPEADDLIDFDAVQLAYTQTGLQLQHPASVRETLLDYTRADGDQADRDQADPLVSASEEAWQQSTEAAPSPDRSWLGLPLNDLGIRFAVRPALPAQDVAHAP